MTALTEYQRLECPGIWRAAAGAQRREVIVALGDATVVISDSRSERALAHWSLPAVLRLNAGEMPALYAPGDEHGETLEIDEPSMVAALEKVHSIIEARRPHPGRLRMTVLGGIVAGVAALGIFWLPGALVGHTAAALPFAKRQEIGVGLLNDLARVGGAPCASRLGDAALAQLATRLFGEGATQIFVMREGVADAIHLPGQILVMNRRLVEAEQTPEVAAGYLLAERLRAEASDPMVALLDWAGLRATFRLLTTGELPPEALAGYAEVLLTAPPTPLDQSALLSRFAAAGVGSSAYAYALDPSGESVLALIEADPHPTGAPGRGMVLPDADWVALQGICGD